jgi:hypothetical protein
MLLTNFIERETDDRDYRKESESMAPTAIHSNGLRINKLNK